MLEFPNFSSKTSFSNNVSQSHRLENNFFFKKKKLKNCGVSHKSIECRTKYSPLALVMCIAWGSTILSTSLYETNGISSINLNLFDNIYMHVELKSLAKKIDRVFFNK
jgi:hypothetical protein